MAQQRGRVTESQLQDAIRLAIGQVPGLCLWRNNQGVAEIRGYKVRFGVANPGGGDLVGWYRGRWVEVEIKTAAGRQSPEQRQREQLVRNAGGLYIVLRSVDEAILWAASLPAAHRDYLSEEARRAG
jgi:hypothetical protein